METEIDQREKDIQTVCKQIVTTYARSTGDYGSGAECPFCEIECRWDAGLISEIKHKSDCIYLIAKDLLTNQPTP